MFFKVYHTSLCPARSCCSLLLSLLCCSGSRRGRFSGVYHSWTASFPPPPLTSPETHAVTVNMLAAAHRFLPLRQLKSHWQHLGIFLFSFFIHESLDCVGKDNLCLIQCVSRPFLGGLTRLVVSGFLSPLPRTLRLQPAPPAAAHLSPIWTRLQSSLERTQLRDIIYCLIYSRTQTRYTWPTLALRDERAER